MVHFYGLWLHVKLLLILESSILIVPEFHLQKLLFPQIPVLNPTNISSDFNSTALVHHPETKISSGFPLGSACMMALYRRMHSLKSLYILLSCQRYTFTLKNRWMLLYKSIKRKKNNPAFLFCWWLKHRNIKTQDLKHNALMPQRHLGNMLLLIIFPLTCQHMTG